MELTLEDRMQRMRDILAKAGVKAEVTNVGDEIIVTPTSGAGAENAGKVMGLVANVITLDELIGIHGVYGGKTVELKGESQKRLRDLVKRDLDRIAGVPPKKPVPPDPLEKNEYGMNREARRKAAKAKRLQQKRDKKFMRENGRRGGQKL